MQAKAKARFTSLLKEATNEIREESDNLLAVDKQVEEAIDLLGEWIQETNDFKLAQELAEAMEQEEMSQRRLDIIKGETAALKLAVDEKRRLKADAEAKQSREREDAELARKIAAEEEKFAEDSKKQYEADEKLCKDLLEDDDKSTSFVVKEDMKASPKNKVSADDDKIIRGNATDLCEHKDDGHEDSKEELPDTSRDRDLAKSIARKEYRRDFQKHKRSQKVAFFNPKCDGNDEATIARLWEVAAAEVDDVQGAVCLTLLLPNIKDLQVNIEPDGLTVRIEAKRMVFDRYTASTDNAHYIAEFHLDGRNLRVSSNDINYEYSSDSGLLHVYIEEVCLDVDSGSSSKAASSSSFNNASSASEKKRSMLKSIQNNFLRIFGNTRNNRK